MPLEEFPAIDPGYSVFKIPVFRTQIISYGEGAEQRISRSSTPRWKFRLRLGRLSRDNAYTILDFFTARKGAFEAFYFANVEEAYGQKPWEALTSYEVGDIVRPTTINRRSYKCTAAGVSGAGEPAWPATPQGEVADGGVTWKENSYLTRFEIDELNFEYFRFMLFRVGEVTLIGVAG